MKSAMTVNQAFEELKSIIELGYGEHVIYTADDLMVEDIIIENGTIEIRSISVIGGERDY